MFRDDQQRVACIAAADDPLALYRPPHLSAVN